MFEKIKICIFLLILVGLSACGYDYDWMKGDFEGETKLFRSDYSRSSELIRTGAGRINFELPFYARLGGNTPLPDCNLKFVTEKEPFKYSLDFNGVEYRGESNDGRGCAAYLFVGEGLIPIDISSAEMTYKKDSGEVVMNLKFNIRDDTYKSYEFEFRGKKKGWF